MPAKKKKRIPLIAKIAFIAVCIYLAVNLVYLRQQITAGQEKNEQLKTEYQEKTQVIASLSDQVDSVLDNSSIAAMAREKLGLVFPGETVYYDVSN